MYQVFCTLVLIGLVSAFDIEETSVDIEYALIESPLSSTTNMTTAVLSSCATSLHINQLLAAAFLSLFMFLLT